STAMKARAILAVYSVKAMGLTPNVSCGRPAIIALSGSLAYASGAACVLRAPFWTGATHVVQLRPIRIKQRGREPAPSSRRTDDALRGRGREQHSRDIRVREGTHVGSPWTAAWMAALRCPKW